MSAGCVCFSDASNEKGAHVVIGKDILDICFFPFPEKIARGHINAKEAYAAWKGVERASILCPNEKITWITDSRVVYYGAKNGRSKNKDINMCVQGINDTNAWIRAVWVPSAENVADGPTRNKEIPRKDLQNAKQKFLEAPTFDISEAFWDENLNFSRKWRRGGVFPLKR